MDIKYTKDGKKVVVVGKLNATQSIVQEIFVSADGTELPAGDNFVASNLLSEPIKSWQENRLATLQTKYDEDRKLFESNITQQRKRYEVDRQKLQEKTKQLDFIYKNIDKEPFTTLFNFIEDKITHFVCINYNETVIKSYDDVMFSVSQYDSGGLKLLTLYGTGWTPGDSRTKTPLGFTWKISQYDDGSGNRYELLPATSYENAIQLGIDYILTKHKNEKRITEMMLKFQHKYCLKIFSDEELIEYYEKVLNNIQSFNLKNIEKLHSAVQDSESEIKQIKDILKQLNKK